ncbi:MAG: flagellar biosynthesis protein FliQ [Deltaproteobacteria bacterium]|nr:flagellar biosynthesis protein FliQ [Deltaproteobacteria bacterium]MBI3295015.1 flagellar biosynthesis protein FliQ [Deltaproteobacteria bacterium]
MQSEQVLDITRLALKTVVLLSAPMLVFGLVVGVLMNVFQAVTQITENTLSFVPKLAAMTVALVIFSPWMMDVIIDFTTQVFENIPNIVR